MEFFRPRSLHKLEFAKDTFGLSDKQFEQVVNNTRIVAGILRDTCHAGKLRFDLDPATYLATTDAIDHKVDCDNPGR